MSKSAQGSSGYTKNYLIVKVLVKTFFIFCLLLLPITSCTDEKSQSKFAGLQSLPANEPHAILRIKYDAAIDDVKISMDGLRISPPLSWASNPNGVIDYNISPGDHKLSILPNKVLYYLIEKTYIPFKANEIIERNLSPELGEVVKVEFCYMETPKGEVMLCMKE